ncbi:MAG: SGNH/GDSL hydrolase family protein [Nocardioidaceae bacterium]|nr:SGNH/GDSL hydrolase family protein [Nocardioidaceae bacterium]
MDRLGRAGALLAALVVTSGALAACQDTPVEPESAEYVALGDSYTGAPGLGSVVDPSCSRSGQNYPSLLAQERRLDLVDVSCGSAWSDNASKPQRIRAGSSVDPQLDALAKDTQLVTVSLGANDEGLVPRIIFQCPAYVAAEDPSSNAPCSDKDAKLDDGSSQDILDGLPDKLSTLYRDIRKRAPEAKIIAVGYPQMFPSSGTCNALPLREGDLAWADGIVRGLNDAVKAAAERTDVTYLDVYTPTEGHDICAKDPWIAGKDAQAGKAAPFHPFAAEQELVAKLLNKTLDQAASK